MVISGKTASEAIESQSAGPCEPQETDHRGQGCWQKSDSCNTVIGGAPWAAELKTSGETRTETGSSCHRPGFGGSEWEQKN